VLFLWNKGNKSKKVSVVWYIAKTMNTQTEFEIQENTSMIAGNDLVARASHRSFLYWVYMNGSRCHEDMDRWATRFDIGIFGQRMGGRCQSVSCGCPVLRRGGCCGLMLVSTTSVSTMLVSRGARCEGVSCEVSVCEIVSRCFGCRSRSGSLNGVVSYKACRRCDESLSGGGFLYTRL